MAKVDWDKVAHSNERILQLAYTVMHPSRRSPHTPLCRRRVRKMAFALARRSRGNKQRVFKSGFFCAAFLSVALTASPNSTSPPARGSL